ncbi:LacI family DNA-binding transcriptional regulator [Halomonas elongata]|uniref:LacI family DNA-binding transcriptional regulator n=1 Tax=Halomonas elongata TaxID=2746 RepID=UPI00255AB3E2|nr:LacI family DNA-binding transcriptional regulator [Halomonas elongata]MDL4863385.1 LacI family DNA-binding transcriptional regulator [Halomonas elongata]
MSSQQRSRRSTKRVTMTDVAKLSGVSASTVSLYLRRPDEVSDTLSRRIQEAIDTLGYVPNLMAGALAAAKTRVIGVVVPSMVNSMFASTVSHMQLALSHHGYQLLLGHSEYFEEQEESLVRTFMSWSPSAMVLTGLQHTRETSRILTSSAIPVVEMWELGSNAMDTMIGFSHEDVGRTQARHLISSGCRRLAFIGARLSVDNRARLRATGVRTACRELLGGADCRIIDTGTGRMAEAARKAVSTLLAEQPDVDGIVFSNDVLALGAISQAQTQGIRIPDDIAVVGFGDMDFSNCCVPAISTVRPPREEIGDRVATSLLDRLQGKTVEPSIDLGFELLVRESSTRQAGLATS